MRPPISLYVKVPVPGEKPTYTTFGAGFPHDYTYASDDGKAKFDLALTVKGKAGGYVKITKMIAEDGQEVDLTKGFPSISVDLTQMSTTQGDEDGPF